MKITLVSSSTRAKRNSHRVTLALEKQFKHMGIEVLTVDLLVTPLPLFTERYAFLEEVDKTNEMNTIAELLQKADGIVFITPEYNGSISTPLKNLIDTFGKNEFAGKPIGISTVSMGILGGMRAAQQLQQMILALQAYPQPQMLLVPEVTKNISESGEIIADTFKTKIDTFTNAFEQYVKKFN